jgi:glycosyltransferase involved in cell wall biosynthesis
MSKRILLLSPYDIASHCYWWEGLKSNFPEYQWTVLTLPARYFSWRMRGNSLSWAYEQKQVLEQHYDLLIACSMTDLSSLRGFIPNLSTLPTIVYCHENQFYYPANEQQQGKLEQQIIQIYNFECADKVVFNSDFNRDSCLNGIAQLLNKLPDHVPKNLVKNIKDKSEVLSVPIHSQKIDLTKNQSFTITWNHRWEYDKGLEHLLCLIKRIVSSDMDCKINILGQQFRKTPDEISKVISLIKDTKFEGTIGYIENRLEYFKTLASSHLVLSNSLHEFQGLAIMEAVKLNCVPVLPNRLSYQEFFPTKYLHESIEKNPEKESEYALKMIKQHYQDWKNNALNIDTVLIDKLPSWENKKTAYKELISGLCKN